MNMPIWEYLFVHFAPAILREGRSEEREYPPFQAPFTVPTGRAAKNVVPIGVPAESEGDERVHGVAFYINNQRQRVHTGDGEAFKHTCFAELGQQGWELAAVEYGRYIFKRPQP